MSTAAMLPKAAQGKCASCLHTPDSASCAQPARTVCRLVPPGRGGCSGQRGEPVAHEASTRRRWAGGTQGRQTTNRPAAGGPSRETDAGGELDSRSSRQQQQQTGDACAEDRRRRRTTRNVCATVWLVCLTSKQASCRGQEGCGGGGAWLGCPRASCCVRLASHPRAGPPPRTSDGRGGGVMDD